MEILGKLLNFLIQKCCQNGLWNLALEELGRLKGFGYKPTRWTYNALIQVFLKADLSAKRGGGENLSRCLRRKKLCPAQFFIQR